MNNGSAVPGCANPEPGHVRENTQAQIAGLEILFLCTVQTAESNFINWKVSEAVCLSDWPV